MNTYSGVAAFVRMPGDELYYPITQFNVEVNTVVCVDDANHPVNESFYAVPTIEQCPFYANYPSFVLYPKRYIFAEVELRAMENDLDGIVYDANNNIYYSRCVYIKSIIPYTDPRISVLKKYTKNKNAKNQLSNVQKYEIDTAPEEKCYTNDGTIVIMHNSVLHNPDGPSIIIPNGIKRYFLYGEEYHVEYPDGTICHLCDGELHREDGPAIISPSGIMYWQNGELHRVDGPAIENKDGSYEWYYHGIWHNPKGPAIKTAQGAEFYYVEGLMINL
jgi:hypothetical protein